MDRTSGGESSSGLRRKFLESTCAEYLAYGGRVVDETKNTLTTIEQEGRERKVPKDCCKFRFVDGGKPHVVSGKEIKFRPETGSRK